MLKCCSVLLSPVLFLQSKRVATSTKPPPSSEPKVPGARGDYFNSHLQKLGSVKGLQSNAGGTLIAPLARRGDLTATKQLFLIGSNPTLLPDQLVISLFICSKDMNLFAYHLMKRFHVFRFEF